MLKLMRAGDFRHPLRAVDTDLVGPPPRGRRAGRARSPSARGLNFVVDVPESMGPFTIDADKVRDAVLNLLTNAIKFTPDGGEVRLFAELEDDWASARIEVSDSGIGLEPRALAHLFEPFFTEFDVETHSSGEFGFRKRGLGLGLSLVKKFVELHGGLGPRRERAGPGDAGRRRPAEVAATRGDGYDRIGDVRFARRPAAPPGSPRGRLMPTALIVEDEPEANRLLAMIVQLRGYRTRSAFNGVRGDRRRSRTRRSTSSSST